MRALGITARVMFVATLLLVAQGNALATTITFVSSNPISSPDYSTQFTGLPDAWGDLPDPQAIDGFTLDQINGDLNGIWTTYNPGNGDGKGWYPNGGDAGYTEITLTGGGDFQDVALFVGSGFGSDSSLWLAYELLDGGTSVMSGVLSGQTPAYQWLSIEGGGYDTIRLRDGQSSSISIGDGSLNALALDAIYATSPVPDSGSTLALLGGALAALAGLRWKYARA